MVDTPKHYSKKTMPKSAYNEVLRRAADEIPFRHRLITNPLWVYYTLSSWPSRCWKWERIRKSPRNENCFYSSTRFIVICDYDLSNRSTEKKNNNNNNSNMFLSKNKQITIISFSSCSLKQVFWRRVYSWANSTVSTPFTQVFKM